MHKTIKLANKQKSWNKPQNQSKSNKRMAGQASLLPKRNRFARVDKYA